MAKAKSYRELRDELSQIVSLLESADIDIDEAQKAYLRAQQLIKQLEKQIKTAENRIKKTKL